MLSRVSEYMLWMMAASYPACWAFRTWNMWILGSELQYYPGRLSLQYYWPLYQSCSRSVWWERWIWWCSDQTTAAVEEAGRSVCSRWVDVTPPELPVTQRMNLSHDVTRLLTFTSVPILPWGRPWGLDFQTRLVGLQTAWRSYCCNAAVTTNTQMNTFEYLPVECETKPPPSLTA